ncbi:hypothetical protein KKR91_05635 [Arthrobacter jiangjiafuii]|uniref:Uncharacterized protein n=1 Tax=Arthrobacter jiangjiafuii TaxID=2817475 RepID=A0A975M797_9MICC|nr:hypothetical protein [Arthrobacter jiangjiafuii]MBP3044087.1 hypothetical protein [Arthrobacter jiangjiafuii]QWC11069.1 hypothetical protein KKR91_05635 [Arthrobacter jiangjiafuii]
MEFLWIVLTLLAAAVLGWPVTAGVLRLARAVENSGPPFSDSDPAADQDRDAELPAAAAVPAPAGSAAISPAPRPAPTPATAGRSSGPAPGSVLRGGLVIGVLERLAVAASVLAAEPVAIAYVVAIKGLGRYAELKDTPAAAERFIIGTLTSMLWAVAVAAAARAFLL